MSASSSIQGSSDSFQKFFEGIKSGNLKETFKKYPLTEKLNLAALERFIIDDQDLTPESLENLMSAVKKISLNINFVSQINALAGKRLLDLAPDLRTLAGLKAHVEELQNRSSITQEDCTLLITDLFTSIGIESIFNQLESDEDKAWFVQVMRRGVDNKRFFSNELMGVDPDFVMNYLPDGLIRFYPEAMNASLSLEQRIEWAKKCIAFDPQILARELHKIFTINEIRLNASEFLPLTNNLMEQLNAQRLTLNKSDKHAEWYLDNAIHELNGLKERVQELNNDVLGIFDSKVEHTQQYLYSTFLKKESPDAKDGHHWECLGEYPEQSGCYVFKMKREFEDSVMETKTKEENVKLFPAIEPACTGEGLDSINKLTHPGSGSFYALLGFKYERDASGIYLSVPDAKTLEKKWELFRNDPRHVHMELPKLSCRESAGIASSKEFLDALDENDVVVSTGQEFLHDMMLHVMPTIEAILCSPKSYKESQALLRAVRIQTEAVLAKYHPEQAVTDNEEIKQNRAAAALIQEMVAMLYDVVTADNNPWKRNSVISRWDIGEAFRLFNPSKEDSPIGTLWMCHLWKNPTLREHLKTLGLRSAYAEFPDKILKEKWLEFKHEYEIGL